MTKKQLLKKLEKVDDKTIILLSSDSEGNVFSEINDVSKEKGLKYDNFEGEISLFTKADIEDDSDLLNVYPKMKDCVVLYP